MNTTAAIFDLDGTLADTLQDLADAMNWALTQLNQPTHSTQDYRQMVGSGRTALCQRALPDDREDLLDESIRLMSQYYADHCFDTTKLYPGIPELIQKLQADGLKVAVLSNKPHEFVEQTLKLLFPKVTFDAAYGDRDGIPRKPDPMGVLQIAKELQADPANIAYVGDTSIDMDTANRAGMFAIGVTWGFRDRQELIDHNAQKIVDSADELYRAIVG